MIKTPLGVAAAALLCIVATGCQTTSTAALPGINTQDHALNVKDPLQAITVSTRQRSDKRPFAALVVSHAKANGVPVDLAHAVIQTESTYNPKARGAAGEIGLMQIKPATARMMGYTGSASGLYDPATNLKYGMKYLGTAHRLSGGSTCGTILKYNAGHGARSMNPVSKAYCNKVAKLLSK